MSRNGIHRHLAYVDVLAQHEVESIHEATLRVLRETGLTFDNEDARKLLADAGCQVDHESKRVRFPDDLVMRCLGLCPSSFTVKARDDANDLELASGGAMYYIPSIGLQSIDLETWEPKEPTRKDFYDYVRILDALPTVDCQVCFPYWGFEKVPQCMRLLESNAAKLRLSTKAQMEGTVHDNYRWNIEMAKATGQDLLLLCNPAAPLTFLDESVQQVYHYVASDMPFHFCPGPLAGASGPATVAGLLATNNAEIIAGIVLAQVIKPGAKVWAGSMMMVQNMRTGAPAFGDIGNSLAEAAFAQMWRFYQVPCWTSAGGWTSSKAIDYQAGYEMALGAITNALAGSSVLLFQGGLTAELTAHPVKAILDDDIAGMINRFLGGIEVSEDTLAVDLINEVGPMPGNYLGTTHTLDRWQQDCYTPAVADRDGQAAWVKKGKKLAIDHARERMEAILAEHKTTPLPPDQEQAIEDVLKEARQYYRDKGLITNEEWLVYEEDLQSDDYPEA